MDLREQAVSQGIKADAVAFSRAVMLMQARKEAIDTMSYWSYGSIGHDVITLSDGLKYPATLLELVEKYAVEHYIDQPFVPGLADKDIDETEFLKDVRYGILFTTVKDTARTKVIKRWSNDTAYSSHVHGAGFRSAVELLAMVATVHHDTYNRCSMAIAEEVRIPTMSHSIRNMDDWESIWEVYSKLIYHGVPKNQGVWAVRERLKGIGLLDGNLFKLKVAQDKNRYDALAALSVIRNAMGFKS